MKEPNGWVLALANLGKNVSGCARQAIRETREDKKRENDKR